MDYEAVIGLEIHAQVASRSKMFCSCSADYSSAPPNTHVCPVCLGMPGVLPVANERAIEATVMVGLALNCTIPRFSKFDRKNYPYPDLMKGYQISQFDMPLCLDGWIEIDGGAGPRRAGITRVHLEEDTARLSHRDNGTERYTLVDVNRSGVPLMEIVGEPDLRTPEEAGDYLSRVQLILQFLGTSSARMDQGAMRCDANISLRPVGAGFFNPKVEVKNMNSIRSVMRALHFEIERQTRLHDIAAPVAQETRGWDEDHGETVSQRSKEEAHDYRYFPEPDLPPLVVEPDWLEAVRARMPELPAQRHQRLTGELQLSDYDARLLTATPVLHTIFDGVVRLADDRPRRAKQAANWLLGDYLRVVRERELDEAAGWIESGQLGELIDLLDQGAINQPTAKQLVADLVGTRRMPHELVEAGGLGQLAEDDLGPGVEAVLAAASSARAVADYQAGKEQALQYLVGQVMKETRGRAQPDAARELLRKALSQLPA